MLRGGLAVKKSSNVWKIGLSASVFMVKSSLNQFPK
jgi:hypothetical protein